MIYLRFVLNTPEKEKATGKMEERKVDPELPLLKLTAGYLGSTILVPLLLCMIEIVNENRKNNVGSGGRRPGFDPGPATY